MCVEIQHLDPPKFDGIEGWNPEQEDGTQRQNQTEKSWHKLHKKQHNFMKNILKSICVQKQKCTFWHMINNASMWICNHHPTYSKIYTDTMWWER